MKLKLNGKIYNVVKRKDTYIEIVESAYYTLDESITEILDHKKDFTRHYSIIPQNMMDYIDYADDIDGVMEGISRILNDDESLYSIAHKLEVVNGELVAHMLYMGFNDYDCEKYGGYGGYKKVRNNWRNLVYKKYIIEMTSVKYKYTRNGYEGNIHFEAYKDPFKRKYVKYIEENLEDEDDRERYNYEAIKLANKYEEYAEDCIDKSDKDRKELYMKFARLHQSRRMPSNINHVIRAFK